MIVYAVFTCDIHKTRSSMRLEAIADDKGIDDITIICIILKA